MKPPKPYNPLFIPPILADIEELALEKTNIISKYREIGKDPDYAFEEKLWHAFRILGFEVEEYGYKVHGRVPDGAALARRDHYALMFDGKIRKDGYYIGTDDRAIIDYIKCFSDRFEREGIEGIYFLIVSGEFTGDNLSCILRVRKQTRVKNVTLLRAELLLYMIELKLRYPHLAPTHFEGIFLRSGEEISKEEIDKELKQYINL